MKLRLGLFGAALLMLPLLGLWLSGFGWADLAGQHVSHDAPQATPITVMALLFYCLLTNWLVQQRTGNNLLQKQKVFFLTSFLISALLVWLLFYLNYFVASWQASEVHHLAEVLCLTVLFALLMPAVLLTRAWLGSWPQLLKQLARPRPIPAPRPLVQIGLMLPLALFVLLAAGAQVPAVAGLLWLSPLLLLCALQLLWHESTILSGLKTGDFGRLVCAGLAGLWVANLCWLVYSLAGGQLQLPTLFWTEIGFVVFGLICLQLGDVLAEHWRGKPRHEVFQKRRPFPIPVVVKKG